MKKNFRLLSAATALGLALLVTSCGNKNNDPQAQSQSQNAILSGQVTPAESATTVTATDAASKTYTATVTNTGAYAFAAMPVGDYTLTFTPATGYAAPTAVAAKLLAGGTTVSTTTITPAKTAVSFKVDGVSVTAPYAFSQTLAGNRFLTFTVSPGGAPGPTVHIDMEGLTPTLGTYPLNSYYYHAAYLNADFTSY